MIPDFSAMASDNLLHRLQSSTFHAPFPDTKMSLFAGIHSPGGRALFLDAATIDIQKVSRQHKDRFPPLKSLIFNVLNFPNQLPLCAAFGPWSVNFLLSFWVNFVYSSCCSWEKCRARGGGLPHGRPLHQKDSDARRCKTALRLWINDRDSWRPMMLDGQSLTDPADHHHFNYNKANK